VALEEGSMIVNSSRGGGSKDTWVLEGSDGPPTGTSAIVIRELPEMPALGQSDWSGQEQQQQ
jgi:hypothetical protein